MDDRPVNTGYNPSYQSYQHPQHPMNFSGYNANLARFPHAPLQMMGMPAIPSDIAPSRPKSKFIGDDCVFVGDVPTEVSEAELRSFLSRSGTVKEIHYPVNDNGTPKGYAFVRFESVKLANEARHALNNTKLKEKEIRVLEMVNPAKIDLEKNIVVKQITDLNQADLLRYFSQFGEIYSVKISSERNEGFIQFKNKTFNDLLREESFSKDLTIQKLDNNVQTYRFTMLNREIILEPYKKKRTLYFQNLPSDQLVGSGEQPQFDIEAFKKFVEREKRKVLSHKFGYSENFKKWWVFFTFEDHDQAREVYEGLQAKPYNNSYLEIFWPLKREKKVSYTNFKKLYTRSFHLNVTGADVQKLFNEICIPDDCVSVKVKTTRFFNRMNEVQEKKSGFVFVKSQEGVDRIADFFKDPKNRGILGRIYEDNPVLNLLVPYQILKEFKEMKLKNRQPVVNKDQPAPEGAQIFRPESRNFNLLGSLPNFSMNSGNYQAARPNNLNQPKPVPKPVESANSLKELKEHETYNKAEDPKKREILGSILFRKIGALHSNSELVPRITGMLIDGSVFEITEIEELIDDDNLLTERIKEAVDLIEGKNDE